MTERRTARRYNLTLPAVIRVPIERESIPRSGKTRDISTRGAYLLVDYELSPGAELDLTMTLPAEVTGGTEVFIRAIGKVVRVEKIPESGSNGLGAAAMIERFEIVRSAPLAS